MQNPLLALVQTKAGFYNLPKKLGSSFGTFIRCVEGDTAARSGFVVRRSAIDDIGGFPTRSSIEDSRLKSCLEGRGYVTMTLDETLQHGMVPDSFSHHLKQHVTRQLAHVGTAFRLGFFLFSRRALHMVSRWFSKAGSSS
jgi:cellulose synthase/poly-beta-1,6-N-acetylglucosamine synthase-like glycosyltransferase